jgi:integrase
MPAVHLTDALIRGLPAPERGNRIIYDDTVTGLGIRVTATGHKAFVLGYTVRGSGKQRRYTIGDFGDWLTKSARDRARELRAAIDQGGDPLGDIEAEREAPTIADLIRRFREEHLGRLRPAVVVDYERMIRSHVLPHLSESTKVADVRFDDIDALHRKITKAGHPYRANRVVTLLSKAFSLSVKWGWRTDNPCKGVQRNVEHNRERYLEADEMARLTEALAKADRNVGDVIKLLLLTGARRGEVLSMKWDDLNLGLGLWKKPPSSTKQKKSHEIPLSAPACALLAARYVDGAVGFVFPGAGQRGHAVNVWRQWQKILKDAKVTDLRIHDLRHSFASELVSAGHSLPMIGSLLGHRNVQTTSRYAHLYRDARREAVERVGAAVVNAGKAPAEPTPLRRGGP